MNYSDIISTAREEKSDFFETLSLSDLQEAYEYELDDRDLLLDDDGDIVNREGEVVHEIGHCNWEQLFDYLWTEYGTEEIAMTLCRLAEINHCEPPEILSSVWDTPEDLERGDREYTERKDRAFE